MLRRTLLLALLTLLAATPATGRDEEEKRPTRPAPERIVPPGSEEVSEGQIEAIRAGLSWLARQQDKIDGSFNESPDSNIAVTSLVLLTFMANGNTPARGRYSDHVHKGVNFLLRKMAVTPSPDNLIPAGYIHDSHDEWSRMHGHGYATTALALAYGMLQVQGDRRDDARVALGELRRRIQLAVSCIEKAQHENGGWWYHPTPEGHEGSITVCQIQALRMAREAGIRVNKAVVDKAIRYLERSYDPNTGGFCYSLTRRKQQTPALTAAALSALFGLGEYRRTDMVRGGLKYMREQTAGLSRFRQGWFYYANFYRAQTLWQAAADERFSHHWREWWPGMRRHLVGERDPEGYWTYPGGNAGLGISKVYSTAMATLILQVPISLLPLFER